MARFVQRNAFLEFVFTDIALGELISIFYQTVGYEIADLPMDTQCH